MPNLKDDIEKVENKSIEFYKGALEKFVIDKKGALQIDKSELDKYIAVFSLYICSSDNAYKYNLPFLRHQHNKFVAFLHSASGKCDLLRKIVQELRKSPIIMKFSKEKTQGKVTISINDFLVSDLSESITFHKAFSILGAERRSKDNMLTILYDNNGIKRLRTCKVLVNMDSNNIVNYDEIIRLAENVIDTHKTGIGGMPEDGDT